MEFRRTPTKKWLKNLNLEHLSHVFEENGFETVGAISAMDAEDIDVIFQPNGLKLGERRLLEKQIKMLKMKEWSTSRFFECELDPAQKAVSKAVPPEDEASNNQTEATPDRVTTARKGLTYPSCQTQRSSVSPLQSYILHQKARIEDQQKTLYTIEKDRDNFVRERTPKQCVLSTLPTCSKCHLKEGHNRLNCPYPNHCLSSTYCKNIDKHPEDKQALKDLNNKLSEERKLLSSMKEELKNKEQSCESVKNRYVTRIKEILIASNPEKYMIEIDRKSIENWRLINKDSKILEQEFRGKIPSLEEARKAIMSVENLIPLKTTGKTSVHEPYKKLWESRGVSWSKPCDKSSKIGSALTCDASKETDDGALCSPQRKKAALASNSSYIYEDDYKLALGMQNSYETLPCSFDLDAFERTGKIVEFEANVDPEETEQLLCDQENTVMGSAVDKNIEASGMRNFCEAENESRNKSTLNLYALAEAALETLEND